ncbi:UNVERIFIED_CONTAM: hypothetical protein Sangu_1455500 [Sesamum angustifolium]|uniref:Reverse transcriptase zinc-binding domain-containing protein n=1 Tax=Sesamum angustifolium TaxID=2727405 RepID=A0AAW2N712_9LAMI
MLGHTSYFSKLANFLEDCMTRYITVQYLLQPKASSSVQIISPGEDWRATLIQWLEGGQSLGNRSESAKLNARASRFLIQVWVLYKKSFAHLLLWCLSKEEGLHVFKKIQSGCCGAHAETWMLGNKALRVGYFWPIMKQDAR